MSKQGYIRKRFDEVFDLQMGKTPDRKKPSFFGGNNVWLSIKDMGTKYLSSSNECITDEAIEASGIKKVKKGTVVMSFKLTVGKCGITNCDLFTNEAIMAFNVKSNYNIKPEFLYFYLQGYKWQGANKAVMGLTLNKATISKQFIEIPPIEAQEAIVAELDEINEAIAEMQQQIADLDTLALSSFYDMFGDPITNPKGWEVKKLGQLSEIVRGGSPRPISNYLGGNIPWIKIGDATKGDDIYLSQTKEFIIADGLSKTRCVPSGSLIFANCGVSLGFARIIKFEGCIHDGWLALMNINEKEIDKLFLLKSLNSCTDYFRGLAPEGTQPNLNTNIMKSFVQILPPLALQQEFVTKVEAIETAKAELNAQIAEMQTLLASRMDYYFY